MRFLLGVLLGYSMRGKRKPLITVLTTIAFIVYVIVPAIALLALRLDVQHERLKRPAQIKVPMLRGLSYENAETKLHASNLNIRVLATRCDLPLEPGLVIDQTPQPGEEVDRGYPVAVTVTKVSSNLAIAGEWQASYNRSVHCLCSRASNPHTVVMSGRCPFLSWASLKVSLPRIVEPLLANW